MANAIVQNALYLSTVHSMFRYIDNVNNCEAKLSRSGNKKSEQQKRDWERNKTHKHIYTPNETEKIPSEKQNANFNESNSKFLRTQANVSNVFY